MLQHGRLRPVPGVFHCYSGSPETAAILLEMGFYLGFDGPITFKNARKTPEVIRICPHDRLLLETDSPYLTPVPYRGQRNEPAYLPLIGEQGRRDLAGAAGRSCHGSPPLMPAGLFGLPTTLTAVKTQMLHAGLNDCRVESA